MSARISCSATVRCRRGRRPIHRRRGRARSHVCNRRLTDSGIRDAPATQRRTVRALTPRRWAACTWLRRNCRDMGIAWSARYRQPDCRANCPTSLPHASCPAGQFALRSLHGAWSSRRHAGATRPPRAPIAGGARGRPARPGLEHSGTPRSRGLGRGSAAPAVARRGRAGVAARNPSWPLGSKRRVPGRRRFRRRRVDCGRGCAPPAVGLTIGAGCPSTGLRVASDLTPTRCLT